MHKGRKPLILEGARQVGKTWLLKEFGKREYRKLAYVSCDNNPQIAGLFYDFDTERLIRALSAITGVHITPGDTLIVLDEVQEVPPAITALKYFQEDAPDFHIAVAGSLLGMLIHGGTGFPVGKTESLTLHPLSYGEFLMATGNGQLLEALGEHHFEELNAILPKYIELLRQYYFTGGMPAVVAEYVESGNLAKVRRIQKGLVRGYEQDFSKHVPEREAVKVYSVWNSIPGQLAKENRKFIYGAIRKGARAKEYEAAIEWLLKNGLVHMVHRVKKIEKPAKFYEDLDCFKLFVLDLGLLGAMVDAPADAVLIGDGIFSEYKGSFTEQYVAQQFYASSGQPLYYYANERSTVEVDFVFDFRNIYPVEVKAETNLRSKSLSLVLKDSGLEGIRFSMAPYKEQERMVNVPLPFAEEYVRMLSNRMSGDSLLG